MVGELLEHALLDMDFDSISNSHIIKALNTRRRSFVLSFEQELQELESAVLELMTSTVREMSLKYPQHVDLGELLESSRMALREFMKPTSAYWQFIAGEETFGMMLNNIPKFKKLNDVLAQWLDSKEVANGEMA